MPALENEQHELLAQNVANGKSQALSYITAGYPAKNNNVAAAACNRLLKKHPEINERITELKQIAYDHLMNETFKGSVDEITRLFLEDRAFAKQMGQAGAAVSATNGLMKLYGQGSENTNISGAIDIKRTIVEK